MLLNSGQMTSRSKLTSGTYSQHEMHDLPVTLSYFDQSDIFTVFDDFNPEVGYSCSDVMEEYQKKMKGLSGKLIRLMLGSLGLDKEDVKWLNRPKRSSTNFPQVLQLNSYPVCPDPTRAMGLAPHTDTSIFTVLNQCDISGLQVFQEEIGWMSVQPIPGALVVNVGDLTHILSNGRFKTTMHREVVNELHHRISMAYFYGPPL